MKQKLKKVVGFLLLPLMLLAILPVPVYADSALDGAIEITVANNDSTWCSTPSLSVSGTTATAKATVGSGLVYRTVNYTVTIKNASAGTLSFNWSVANSSSFTDPNGGSTTSGTYCQDLTAGSSVTMTVKATSKSTTATLTITDLAFDAATGKNTTFNFNSNGKVSVGGTSITSGTTQMLDANGVQLVATPNSGCSFLGWVNANTRAIISSNATYTYGPLEEATIEAVFVNSTSDTAWFTVDSKYLTTNLTTASSLGTKIVLVNNGTLSGTHTIAAGDTLLIPCDDAYTVYTTVPGNDGNDSYTAPTVFRKLTMAQGANITVNGAISIGGKAGTHMVTDNTSVAAYTNGAPSGPLGFIDMADDSNITVNSGGNLYAWGFITGSGSVAVKSGGTVYEDLQIRDYRGGDGTTSMIENDYKVFPFTQYYIQNVEVPLKLEAGATEKVCMTVSVTVAGVQQSPAVYIGNNTAGGLIRLTSGSLTKTYDGGKDRIVYDIDGDISFANLNVSIKVAFLASAITIDSQDYVMNITNNMTLNANGDSKITLNQDMALLPGAVVNIGKDAKVTLGSGNKLFVYDRDAWSASYVGIKSVLFDAVKYAPGRKYTRTSADIVDAEILLNGTLDATNGHVYTTSGNVNIHSTGNGKLVVGSVGTDTVTYQVTQSGTDITGYPEIAVTNAQLLNGDGTTYVQTANGGTNTYTYTDGKWICQTHTGVTTDHTCDVCGFVTECADTNPADHNCDICGKEGLSECKDEDSNAVCDICGTNLCTHANATGTEAVAESCTGSGNSAYWSCPDCGKFFSDAACTTEIAKNSWIISSTGCSASGDWLTNEDNTKHYQVCGTCGEVVIEEAHSGGTATCMTPATCDVCKQSYGSVDSNNHNFSAEWSTDGSGHWKVCLNGCGVKGSEGNHSGGTANCQDQAVCETCQTAYGNVDGNNHKTVKTDAAQAPDCTNTGLTEGSHCEACNTVIVAQTQIDDLGHEAGAAATCTTAQTCIRCDYVFKAALGHSYTNYVSNGDAKCEVDGTETAKCDRCSETNTRTDEGSALGHSYTNYVPNNNATCQSNGTETATCDNGCGGTVSRTIENSTVGHSYGEYVSDNNATCLNDGTKTAECIWCGNKDTVTEAGSALGHDWSDYVSNGDATCLADGTKTRTCGREGCGVEETVADEDSALGHSFTNYVPNDDAVCGTDGTKTAKCDRCDATDTVTNEGSALDHQFTTYTYNNDAKCGVNGTRTAECDYGCGETSTITAEGTALTHSYTNYISDGNATCTQDGTKSAYCAHGCGTKDTVADEDSALGHNFTYTSDGNATCTANGTETGTCSRCDATDTQEIPNSMLDHSYTNYVSDENATCTTNGTKTAQCDNCASTSTITDEGSMLDHSYGDWEVETSATCTTNGTKRRDCANCDAYETQDIVSSGHNMGDWYVSNAATCEISGEQRRNCSVCEYYETEVINALTHSYTSVTTQQPTCVDKGVETYTCSNCQNSYTQEIAATGAHTGGDPVREKVVEATCGEAGSYESVVYCTICNAELSRTSETIEATGEHNYESAVTVEPTCIAVGERTYTCSVCNDAYTEEIKMVAHTVSEEYTTENGKHFRACTTDGCEYVTEEAECSGGEATCKDLAVCEICGEAYGELDPENHTGGTEIRNDSAATCTAPGYTGDTYCLDCDTKIAEGETIAASGHGCTAVVTPPTCVTEGYTTFTCGTCGYSYTDDITPATGEHTYVDKACSVCGKAEPIVHYGQNLRLQDLIKIGYYFYLNTDEDVEEVGALLWTAEQYAEETDFTVNSTLARNYQNLQPATGIYYIVETDGIYAQNLDDTFVLIPYYITANGDATYGSSMEYSPLHYAKKALAPDSKAAANTKLLVKDLLNFGTAAKKYFCVQKGLALPDEPFNMLLNEEDRQIAWDESMRADYPLLNETGTFTANYYGRNINLLSAISIGIYYSNPSEILGAYYWNDIDYATNSEHIASTKTSNTTDEYMGSNYIKVNVPNIYAYNIYDVYYIRAYNSAGDLSDTIGTSVAAYLTQLMDKHATSNTELSKASVEIAQAMMVYGQHAASILK